MDIKTYNELRYQGLAWVMGYFNNRRDPTVYTRCRLKTYHKYLIKCKDIHTYDAIKHRQPSASHGYRRVRVYEGQDATSRKLLWYSEPSLDTSVVLLILICRGLCPQAPLGSAFRALPKWSSVSARALNNRLLWFCILFRWRVISTRGQAALGAFVDVLNGLIPSWRGWDEGFV